MILKSRVSSGEYLVTLCDNDLLGMTLTDGDVMVVVSKSFYGEREAGVDEVITELNKATLINAIGSESVSALKRVKGEVNIINIGLVPHAQWITMK